MSALMNLFSIRNATQSRSRAVPVQLVGLNGRRRGVIREQIVIRVTWLDPNSYLKLEKAIEKVEGYTEHGLGCSK
jgi:hypothetical protein